MSVGATFLRNKTSQNKYGSVANRETFRSNVINGHERFSRDVARPVFQLGLFQ